MTISEIQLLNDKLLGGAHVRTIARAAPRASSIHGIGLFAEADIAPDTLLCELNGQIVSVREFPHVLGALEWNAITKDTLLVRALRTSYGFINHALEPNCAISAEGRRLSTSRTIAAGTELTLNYLDQPLPEAYLQRDDVAYLHT